MATLVNGAAVTLSANRTYRPDGLLLGQSVGNGVSEVRQYDTQGRLSYQAIGTADTRLYDYDANGNLKRLQSLPLVGAYTYDVLDRLSLDQRTTTASVSSSFTYDANGNRKTENSGTYSYAANSNRLSTTPVGAVVLDAAGNTTSDGTRSYTYNSAGQVSTVAGAQYSYNAQRQRTRKVVGSVGTVFHYDLQGNLIAESDTAGAIRRSYVWAEGQPLALIEAVTTLPADMLLDNTQATFTGSWGTSTSLAGFYGANYRTNTKGTGKDKAVWTFTVPSSGTYQVYARWVAATSHASNAPFTVKHGTGSQTVSVNQRSSNGQWVLLGSYSFSSATAGSVTLTDKANGLVIADAVKLVAISGGTASEGVRYLHSDHLNTPRLATNASGVKIWSWEGEACGATQPTGSVTINLRFPGQYWDAESGLHYNWNRYYDPKLCRYITSDPVGLEAGHNTYAYVGNNPLTFNDPLGLIKWRGTAIVHSFAVVVGYGLAYFDLKTDCINKKRGYVTAVGYGGAFGAGFKLPKLPKDIPSGTGSGIEFEDNKLDVDPSSFGGGFGSFQSVSFSGVIGTGVGHSLTRCGQAFAYDWDFFDVVGLDAGATGIYGTCTVLSSRVESCCDE